MWLRERLLYMLLKKLVVFTTTLFCILLLSSCGYKIPSLKRFPVLEPKQAFCQVSDQIKLMVKAFTAQEAENHFGVDLVGKGYIPLQVKIDNQSANTYTICPSYVGLSAVSGKKIAKLLHWDTSFFMWSAGYPALLFWWPATIWVAQGGYGMYKANKKTDKLVQKCCLESERKEIHIKPYDIFERFIFVHKNDFTSNFEFKLYNEDDKRLVRFNVSLADYEFDKN